MAQLIWYDKHLVTYTLPCLLASKPNIFLSFWLRCISSLERRVMETGVNFQADAMKEDNAEQGLTLKSGIRGIIVS